MGSIPFARSILLLVDSMDAAYRLRTDMQALSRTHIF
jgi:hypothetical protein